jgi:hypothetical protein
MPSKLPLDPSQIPGLNLEELQCLEDDVDSYRSRAQPGRGEFDNDDFLAVPGPSTTCAREAGTDGGDTWANDARAGGG